MAPKVTQLVITSRSRVPTENCFWIPSRAPEMTPWS